MGVLLTNNEEKEVYSAYGMAVYCVENENIWLENHDSVYTAIRIEKDGENCIKYQSGSWWYYRLLNGKIIFW